MKARFRIPLRVGIPIVVLSGIVGVAAGVWLPVSETPPLPPVVKQATPASSEPLPDVADPAPQQPPAKQAMPAMSLDPAPRAAAALPQPPEEKPEPASHQPALPAPTDQPRHEPEHHATTASTPGSPTRTADTRDDGPAKDSLETPRLATAPESKSSAFSSAEQLEPPQQPVAAPAAAEKKRRPPRRVASTPTRRITSAKQRRDSTADARDRPPPRPAQPRPVLSQLPIIGPVFGLFTR